MALSYRNLDELTRQFMVKEINSDIANNILYISARLTEMGKKEYPQELIKSVETGDDLSLEGWICGHLNSTEPRKTKNGYTEAKIPHNAAETLAEGEFNRFYIRALCRRILDVGTGKLIVYRAKSVNNARSESEAKIGQAVDAKILLNDLRNHIGLDTFLGIPAGPNSGLSVELTIS